MALWLRARRLFFLTAALLAIAIIPSSFPAAHAVSVFQPVTLSVSPSGSATITWTISGCSASPTTIPGDGVSHTITANESCLLTISYTNSGTTTRYAFGGGTASWTFTTCLSGTCLPQARTYFLQYYLTVNGGSGGPSNGQGWHNKSSTATASSLGTYNRIAGAGLRVASYNIDGGTNTVASTTATVSVSVTMNIPHTVNFNTVQQYQLTLDPGATAALNSVTNPAITNDNYWYDTGKAVTLVLNGVWGRTSGSGSRLSSYTVNGGTSTTVATTSTVTALNLNSIAAPQSVTTQTKSQFQLTLDSAASSALNSTTSPSIPGDNYWYDSGATVVYTANGVFGRMSGVGMRVTNWWVDSGSKTTVLTAGQFTVTVSMLAAHTVHLTEVLQYQVSLSGNYHISSITAPTVPGDNYWYDSGGAVTASMDGSFGRVSGNGSRMAGYSVNGGPMITVRTTSSVLVLSISQLGAPQRIAVFSSTQYQITLDPTSVTALSSVTPPSVEGDNYWYDSGTRVTLKLAGVWERVTNTGFRLTSYSLDGASYTPVATTGAISVLDSVSIDALHRVSTTYTNQYLLSVGGGAGFNYSTAPPIPGDTGWYDAGTSVSVFSDGVFSRSAGVGRRVNLLSVDGVTSPANSTGRVSTPLIVMNKPHTVTFSSVTQYEVRFAFTDNSGRKEILPSSFEITPLGGSPLVVRGTSTWLDDGTRFQVTGIAWEGANIQPPLQNSYLVDMPLDLNLKTLVFDTTIKVKDFLGLAVSGAVVQITFNNSTTISANAGADGAVSLRMIPVGSFTGRASNLGFSSEFRGDASVQQNEVTVPLSYSLLLLITAGVIVVAVLLLYRRRTIRSRVR